MHDDKSEESNNFTGQPPEVDGFSCSHHARIPAGAATLPCAPLQVLVYLSYRSDRKDPSKDEWILEQIPIEYADLRICWPSVGTIAADLNCSKRKVQDALSYLKKAGYIYRQFRDNQSTIYIMANYSDKKEKKE